MTSAVAIEAPPGQGSVTRSPGQLLSAPLVTTWVSAKAPEPFGQRPYDVAAWAAQVYES